MLASLTSLALRFPRFRRPGKWFYVIALALIIAGAAAAWYLLAYAPAQAAQDSNMQTAAVRQGELTLSATGSGTLTAPEEDLAFTAGGDMLVTGVYVKAGDLVQAGEVLAEVDKSQAQTDYDTAHQAYLDLTSSAAVASAAQAIADAQTQLRSAKSQLEYLISPDVMYWEGEVDSAETALKKATANADESPTDEQAQKKLKHARAVLDYMQEQLAGAQKKYWKEYVPETFPIAVDGDTDTYYTPTDLEIEQARLAIGDAKTALKEAQELYAVLTGDPMPEQTSNESLNAIKQAKSNLDEAKARLDGAKIVAPFAGTVMQVNVAGGDTTAIGPTESDVVDASNAVVIADTSNPYLQVYWNESDWGMVKVGTTVEITFDDLPDQVFSGKVTEVDSELANSNNSNVVRGDVSLDAAYTDLALPVGASASVVVVSQRAEDAIYIPVEALHDIGSGKYVVFVLVDGKPKVRTVEVGIMSSQYVQITSGLEVGDTVTTGLTKTK